MRYSLLSTFLLLGFHSYFSYGDAYVGYVWFDNIMHFIGGIVAGYLVFTFLRERVRRGGMVIRGKWLIFLLSISGAEFLGVLWEFFEYLDTYLKIFIRQPEFMSYADTISDLFLDLAGASLAVLFCIILGSHSSWVKYDREKSVS